MKVISRGYLYLRDEDVRLDPWSIAVEGREALASPERIDDWSYYQTINIRATVVAEAMEVARSLQLSESAKLGLVILWVSPGTSLRGASDVVPLGLNETSAELSVDGGLLRGDLRLECQVVLISEPNPQSKLAPSQSGSILWTSSHTVRLEGVGSRMPVLSVPFSSHLSAAGNHGLWWLQTSGRDFFAPADSALWMWLNSESDAIQELLSQPESDGAKRTQQFLRMDFYRQLIEVGLASDDFSFAETYPSASLGAVIAAPLRLIGPNLDELRGSFESDRLLFEAKVQATLGGLN